MTLTTRTPSALASALRDIQAPVRTDLSAVSQELWRIVSADVPLVQEVQQHLMGMKGKLFRPTLLLLSASIDSAPPRKAITLAAIIELIHLATLVHDDAVDHSVLRRGMPTVNALFSHQVSVIMGDYLYLRALRELVTLGDLEAMRAITFASNEMTLGEIRQLAAFDALAFSERDYETLIRAKTASLFMAACDVGALCGTPRHRTALTRFGERLGMAFQVADDLLDYTEPQEMTGKPSGLDLKEHKVTLPLIEVVGIVRQHGGLEYARRRADQFSREAEDALGELPDCPSRAALLDAISYVVERRW